MTITIAPPTIQFVVSPFPIVGAPVWDDAAFEWVMTDEDGAHYWGDNPSACMQRYSEAMSRLAEHARKSGYTIEELRAFWRQERDYADQRVAELPA